MATIEDSLIVVFVQCLAVPCFSHVPAGGEIDVNSFPVFLTFQKEITLLKTKQNGKQNKKNGQWEKH